MSVRVRRLVSMSRRREKVTKKQVRKSLVQILGREICKPVNVAESPTTKSQSDFVPFQKDRALSLKGEQQLTVECDVKRSMSRNVTSTSEGGLSSSPVPRDTEVNMQSEVTSILVAGTSFNSPASKMLNESKKPTSPVNLFSCPPKVAESKKDRSCLAGMVDGDSSKISHPTVGQCEQQTSEKPEKRLCAQPSSSSANDENKSVILTNSPQVTTPSQSSLMSAISTPLLKKPSKSEKRKKLSDPKLSTRKKRRLDSDFSNIRPTEDICSTEKSQIDAPFRLSPTEMKNSISAKTPAQSIKIHGTPNLSKEGENQLSKGFVSVSPSRKRNDIYSKTKPRSSQRIRARKLRANYKKEPKSLHSEVTLVTPQRLVLEEKKRNPPSLKTTPRGGKRLKPPVTRFTPHSKLDDAKSKVVKRVRHKARQRQIRRR